MTIKNHTNIGFLALTALCGALTGCVDGPHNTGSHAHHRSGTPGGGVVAQDDYVYYPSQQVYYSSNRQQYIYQEHNRWVTRSSPPRVSAKVLHTSPSVKMDFHDSPQAHHASVVKQYPKQWSPSGKTANNAQKIPDNSQPNAR